MRRLLVMGTAEDRSLGSWCVTTAHQSGHWDAVETAGVDKREDYTMDIRQAYHVHNLFRNGLLFTDVICCIGVNEESDLSKPYGGEEDYYRSFSSSLKEQWQVNALGPLMVFEQWRASWMDHPDLLQTSIKQNGNLNFVAISSNSAHIARSMSTGYCMSKAALSMGIRCVARACADEPINAWCYEPGYITGTPMSREIERRFGAASHRIPGNRTLRPGYLAQRIVNDICENGLWLNGCCIRTDGGEQ